MNSVPDTITTTATGPTNRVDMREDGHRWQLLAHYSDNSFMAVKALLKAWDVTDTFDVDVYDTGKMGVISHTSRRTLMLLCDDGLWRLGTFGGYNGSPSAWCQSRGFLAATGKIALVKYRIDYQQQRLIEAQQELDRVVSRLNDLVKDLRDAEAEGKEEDARAAP